MAYDSESLIATALERLNENMIRMDERWTKYQEKTDAKLDKMSEVLGKLVYIDTEVKESSKRIHNRIDEIEKRVEKVEINQHEEGCPVHKQFITQRNEQVVHFKKVSEDLDTRLKAIEGKGSKVWEVARNKAIEWSVVFVIGAVLLKFGVGK